MSKQAIYRKPDIMRFDPLRPVNWREEVVLSAIENRSKPKTEDKYIKEYFEFLKRYRKTQKQEDSALYLAYKLKESENSEPRAIIEARILAGQSDEEIADLSATLPTVIDYYEQLFFNVRDRLNSPDYIRNTVLLPSLRSSGAFDIISDYKRQAYYKFVAYTGGPLVLDTFLMMTKSSGHPTHRIQLEDWVLEQFHTVSLFKGLMAIQLTGLDRENLGDLLGVCMNLVNILEKRRENAGTVESQTFEQAVSKFLQNINIVIGENSLPTPEDNPNAEPRAIELVSAGIDYEEIEAETVEQSRTGKAIEDGEEGG